MQEIINQNFYLFILTYEETNIPTTSIIAFYHPRWM
nr:MAG TPA: hypothetical protein [Caudoviricetes sp.]